MGKHKDRDKVRDKEKKDHKRPGGDNEVDRYRPSTLMEDLGGEPSANGKLERKLYEKELARLQVELVKMQYWVKATGFRLIVLFEGREAAGKGGGVAPEHFRPSDFLWAFLLTAKQDTLSLGFLVNSETGHSEDRQPNLRHALGSVKRVKVRATGDLRAHPLEVVGHRPALPACRRLVTDTPPWQVTC